MANCANEMEIDERAEIDESSSDEDSDSEDNEDDSDLDSSGEISEETKLRIKELDDIIKSNPYQYDNHVEFIKLLHKGVDLEKLRLAREHMSSLFPLSEELWLEWIKDEVALVSESDERNSVLNLFERAVKDYIAPDVWLEYVQFAIGGIGQTDGIVKAREIFERALTAVSLHFSKGTVIWDAYREFENAIYAGLQPLPGAVLSKELQQQQDQQVQRIHDLFKRQLCVPLLDMETTFEEYKQWATDGVDVNVEKLYAKALEKKSEIEPYETALANAVSPRLQAYEDYIKYELDNGNPARVQCLYERMIKENCLNVDVWLQYFNYLVATAFTNFVEEFTSTHLSLATKCYALRALHMSAFDENVACLHKYLNSTSADSEIIAEYKHEMKLKASGSIVLGVCERAVRNCPWAVQLWDAYLLSLERHNQSSEKIKEIFNTALGIGYASSSEYLQLWRAYADYLRRQLDPNNKDSPVFEELRGILEQANNHLAENFTDDVETRALLLQHWAQIEAKYFRSNERYRELWNEVLQLGFGSQADYWLEYIIQEKRFGDEKHCRKIFQRALNSVTDYPEKVVEALLNFERLEGTLEQLDQAKAKCDAQMQRIRERREKETEKEAEFRQNKKQLKQNKPSQKLYERAEVTSLEERRTPSQTGGAKWKQKDTKGYPQKRKQYDSFEQRDIPVYQRGNKLKQADDVTTEEKEVFKKPDFLPFSRTKNVNDLEEPETKRQKLEVQSIKDEPLNDADRKKCTIFVSNISYDLPEDQLKEILSAAGEVREVRLALDGKGSSRGFGYVEFVNEQSVPKALAMDRTPVGRRPMYISQIKDKTAGPKEFQYNVGQLEKNKLFVRGLPTSLNEEKLKEIFAPHGSIKEIRIVVHKNGISKGFAYVEFENEHDAQQAVIKCDGMTIGDKTISVAISNPPPRRERGAQDRGAQSSSFVPSLGSGKRETTDFRKARTQVALLPRTVMKSAADKSLSAASVSSAATAAAGSSKTGMSNADFRSLLLKQ